MLTLDDVKALSEGEIEEISEILEVDRFIAEYVERRKRTYIYFGTVSPLKTKRHAGVMDFINYVVYLCRCFLFCYDWQAAPLVQDWLDDVERVFTKVS